VKVISLSSGDVRAVFSVGVAPLRCLVVVFVLAV